MEPHNYKELPENPGVYIYRDKNKKILYVGKAINLKNRVSSYFQKTELLGSKTQALVEKIADIDHIVVENEIEALILEADLIKRHRPPYNIMLKDDKYYKYIKVSYDEYLNPITKEKQKIFKVGTSRTAENDGKAKYFGPYPDAGSISIILKTLRKIFPYRDCSIAKFSRYKKLKRPCLYGYIGVCTAPCQNQESIEINNINIKKFKDYLEGDRKKLFNEIEAEMKDSAKLQQFEKAAILRDQLVSYKYLTQQKRNAREYIEKPNLIEDTAYESIIDLKDELEKHTSFKFKIEDWKTFRIEIFDISNFQGQNAVGAMVVLTGGISDKSEYKKFKIQTKQTPDDFAMMDEMLKRRLNQKSWPIPNLIVVDGGKGQLSTALKILAENNLNIPMIGLAKRIEEIVFYDGNDFKLISLPNNSKGLNLLKKGRDEAHRFGITYYQGLHRKKLIS
jgi:excinuclease ABC subunit C